MIIVIEKGIIPEDRYYQTKCFNCGTLFKFQRKDGLYHTGDQREGSWIDIKCPICNRRCSVSEKV
jgi:hypothetical protein